MQGFGESPSAKAQILNLIHSIRTVARSKYKYVCNCIVNLQIIYIVCTLIFIILIECVLMLLFCFSTFDISKRYNNYTQADTGIVKCFKFFIPRTY